MLLKTMLDDISSQMDPPSSARIHEYRKRILRIVLFGLALPLGIYLVISLLRWIFSDGGTPDIILPLGFGLIVLAAWFLNEREHTLFASFLIPTGLYVSMFISTFYTGIGHMNIVGFILAVALAGILLDLWIAICYAFLTVIAFLTLANLQAAGLLLTVTQPLETVSVDALGLFLGLIVIVVLNWISDQTIRRAFEIQQEQMAIKASEERYASLVEGIPIGAYRNTPGPDGRFLMANPAFVTMLGFESEEEILETPVIRLYEDEQQRQLFLDVLLRNGSVTGYPLELIRKDGERIWASVTAKVIYNEDGKTVRHLDGMVEDITARLFQEQALRNSEERYRKTINAMADGIHVIDADLRVRLINRRFQDWLESLGFNRDAIGRRVDDVFPFLSERSLQEYETVFEEGLAISNEEGSIILRDEEIITETRKIPIVENEQVSSVLTVVRDITQRKKNERALQESKLKLEEALQELQATQEHAIRQERLAAVGQLAAGIAHDFNNALMPITLYSEIILQDLSLSPENQDRVNIILKQARQASGLTQQILDFARKGLLRREIINLTTFFADLQELLNSSLPDKVALNLTFSRDPLKMNGDPSRLYQAFLNLALNARDAMPEGGRLDIRVSALTVKLGEEPPFEPMKPGDWIHIEVEDEGIGIPEEHLPRIFEPFFTTKAAGKGSGLGLAQVYGIIKQHNGYILADSEVESGTRFSIFFPAVTDLEPADEDVTQRTALEGVNESILLVEDDAITLQAIAEILSMLNYHVYTAGSGLEALQLYKHNNIDLVLSDLVMPEMGGTELFKELKSVDPDVRMILLTGYPLGDDGKDLLEEGIVGWVHKPLDMQTLSLLIKNALRE